MTFIHLTRATTVLGLIALCAFCADPSVSQEFAPPVAVPPQPAAQAPGEVPKGVEVLARGPVHEAFASPLTEPKATPLVAKKPPLPIEEMPPEERPEGDVVWIGGYFAWNDDAGDFLWVSGCWRIKPAGKEWVPGYWREVGQNWQWVPGFWTNTPEARAPAQGMTYYPEPPAAPKVAPPGDPPAIDMFHVPGYWMWNGDRYVWRAGYWTRVRAGFVYVPSHYRWTPYGHVFVSGYWDFAVSRRGVLYAPITVNVALVGPRYVYTPYYAVRDTIVLDTLFVRPSFGIYYFGDYYGPRYATIGFEPGVVYSRRHYDPVIVYARWEYRSNPRWYDHQMTLVVERNAGRAPLPPRTLVQQTTIINNTTNVTNVIAPTKTVVLAGGGKTVPLDATARTQVRNTSLATQQAITLDRKKTETSTSVSGTALSKPRTTALTVPTTPSIGSGIPKGGTPTIKTGLDSGKGPGTTTFDKGPGTKTFDKGPGPTTRDKGPGGTTIRDSGKSPFDRPPMKKLPDDKKKKGGF